MKKFFPVFSITLAILFSLTLNAQVNDAVNFNPNKAFFTAEVLDAIIKTAEAAGTVKDLPKNISEMSMTEVAKFGQTSFRKIAGKIEATGYIQTGEQGDVALIPNADVTKVGTNAIRATGKTVPVMQQTDQYTLTRELALFFSDIQILNFWKDLPETKGITNFSYAVEACINLNDIMASVILKNPDAIKYELGNVKDAFIVSKFPVNATEIANSDVAVLDALKTLKSVLETVPVSRESVAFPVPVRYQ